MKNLPEIKYQQGFGNEFQTEAIANALPQHQNNPQECPYNLYAEQISGSSFTTRRSHNLRTWMYRMQPSVSSYMHNHPWCEYQGSKSEKDEKDVSKSQYQFGGCDWKEDLKIDPNPMRWGPLNINDNEGKASQKVTFIHGLKTYAGTGSPTSKSGLAIYMYSFNKNMSNDRSNVESEKKGNNEESFYSSDGDFLIVPQNQALKITTELGILIVEPNEICVIPRGIVYRVDQIENNHDSCAFGYVLEVFGGHFTLPEVRFCSSPFHNIF